MYKEETTGGLPITADVIRGVVASIVGMATFLLLDKNFHDYAFYLCDGWGSTNLAHYDELNIFFVLLPYVIGGVITGLLVGPGRVTKLHFPLIRLVCGFGLYCLLNLTYTAFMHPWSIMRSLIFLYPGLLAFIGSLIIDWLYRHWLYRNDHSATNREASTVE